MMDCDKKPIEQSEEKKKEHGTSYSTTIGFRGRPKPATVVTGMRDFLFFFPVESDPPIINQSVGDAKVSDAVMAMAIRGGRKKNIAYTKARDITCAWSHRSKVFFFLFSSFSLKPEPMAKKKSSNERYSYSTRYTYWREQLVIRR